MPQSTGQVTETSSTSQEPATCEEHSDGSASPLQVSVGCLDGTGEGAREGATVGSVLTGAVVVGSAVGIPVDGQLLQRAGQMAATSTLLHTDVSWPYCPHRAWSSGFPWQDTIGEFVGAGLGI